mmetsp:Transcript_6351/g.18257  ORF Transcript_6351/g.18257 Transcript_6351/m.18257 type:complete len:253 (+) Transcript_6351:1542-2300(+)
MPQQLNYRRQHRRDEVRTDELRHRIQRRAHDKHVVIGEVPGDSVHDQHDEVTAAVQKQRRRQISYLLRDQQLAGAGSEGSDVSPAGLVAQHLHVDEAHQHLLGVPLIHPRVFEARLQDVHLACNDGILLSLAFALANGPNEAVELPGEREACLFGHCACSTNRARAAHGHGFRESQHLAELRQILKHLSCSALPRGIPQNTGEDPTYVLCKPTVWQKSVTPDQQRQLRYSRFAFDAYRRSTLPVIQSASTKF